MKLKLKRPLLFFDLETTGLNIDQDRIVQIAAIKYFINDGLDRINNLVNPTIPIKREASDVHNIFDFDVNNKPTFKEQSKVLFDFFDNSDWAGYNILNFDVPLLLNEFRRCGLTFKHNPRYIDCYQIYKEQVSHTLSGAVKFYLKKDHTDAHDALGDVNATVGVFNSQIAFEDEMPNTVEGIYDKYRDSHQVDIAGKLRLNDENKVVVAFGKHKGKRIRQVPEDYLKWCKSNAVFGPDAWDIIRKVYKGEIQ